MIKNLAGKVVGFGDRSETGFTKSHGKPYAGAVSSESTVSGINSAFIIQTEQSRMVYRRTRHLCTGKTSGVRVSSQNTRAVCSIFVYTAECSRVTILTAMDARTVPIIKLKGRVRAVPDSLYVECFKTCRHCWTIVLTSFSRYGRVSIPIWVDAERNIRENIDTFWFDWFYRYFPACSVLRSFRSEKK